MSVTILEKCTGCGSCVAACKYSALSLETELPTGFGSKRAVVDINLCYSCGGCVPACPHQAIALHNGVF